MVWMDQWWMGLNIKLKIYFLFTNSICRINITRSLLCLFVICTVHCAELLRMQLGYLSVKWCLTVTYLRNQQYILFCSDSYLIVLFGLFVHPFTLLLLW
jgi:hypothetical protein